MAINRNNIPQPLITEVIEGLASEESALADTMCTGVDVDATTGTITLEPSTNQLAATDGEGGIAEGAEVKTFDQDLDELAYQTKRYEGRTIIPDGTIMDARAAGYPALERAMRRARIEANFKLDRDLFTVLNTSSTTQAVGNGVWTLDSSTPIEDLQDLFDQLGDPDLLCLGRGQMQALQVHPVIGAEYVNYAGGVIAPDKVVSVLKATFPHLREIYVQHRLYNDQNEGQTVSISSSSFLFGDLTYAGWKKDLILVKCGGPYSETDRKVSRQADELLYGRRNVVKQGHSEMHGRLTGTLA